MKYMLDTNICIHIIRHRPQSVLERFSKIQPDDVCISAITYSELKYGAEKSSDPSRNWLAVSLFLSAISVVPFDEHAGNEYGSIRTKLERHGTPIGAMDMLIAAHAKALGLTLVTNNTREFERVEGLKLDNWVR